jgi:quercetin dioxygenase-like cupin family protein
MEPGPIMARQLAAHTGQLFRVLGDLVAVKAAAVDTGGAYALFEARTAPGAGMPRQVRRYDDAAFVVLEGAYVVDVGDRTVGLGPGDYAFAPRGTAHAYTNVGAAPARLLILVSPGGIHEQFVAEVGALVGDGAARPGPAGPADIARVVAAAEKYGIEFLPPAGSRPSGAGPDRRASARPRENRRDA